MSTAAGGPTLREWKRTIDGTPVYVMKLQDDPLCLRASLGGNADDGYYLTYRGDEQQIHRLLTAALEAFVPAAGEAPGA